MMTLRLAELALVLDARLLGEDAAITAISTDTRTLGPGALFVALRGERFDAHDFCEQAMAAGASALLVERELPLAIPQLIVTDSLKGLGLLGRLVRERVNPKVLAITGSCGKTTVKEMATAILRHEGEVLATAGNFNNEVGVPLTLLRLEPHHQFAVMELGANHPGRLPGPPPGPARCRPHQQCGRRPSGRLRLSGRGVPRQERDLRRTE